MLEIQHDYDCLPHFPSNKKRRHSFASVSSATRSARRKKLLGSGISKLTQRVSIGGMIDGKVFMPGTPAMTLPELLKQLANRGRVGDTN
jgi:hypothetical protein